mgnify:CR=1 FL=1
MIELRWITRTVGELEPRTGPIFYQDPMYRESEGMVSRVLQYRYRAPIIAQDINALPPKEWPWSEWQDVLA